MHAPPRCFCFCAATIQCSLHRSTTPRSFNHRAEFSGLKDSTISVSEINKAATDQTGLRSSSLHMQGYRALFCCIHVHSLKMVSAACSPRNRVASASFPKHNLRTDVELDKVALCVQVMQVYLRRSRSSHSRASTSQTGKASLWVRWPKW